MKVVALLGSPRKEGNTDILIDQILKGAKQKGHETEKIHLYRFDIRPCQDCRGCKEGHHDCVTEDEMILIYPSLEKADIIIFGTPLYWYGPTGQMKLLIDRLRPYIETRKLEGKKAIVITPSEEGPDVCGPLVEMFKRIFKYLGIKLIHTILVKAYEKGEIRQNMGELRKALLFGGSL